MHPQASKAKPCCIPSGSPRERSADTPPVGRAASAAPRPATRGMIALAGGEFLMGTDYPGSFEADGEGPVRPVVVSPFSIREHPATNDEFAAFVAATGYRTEAERIGWSFVFWKHIPAGRFSALVRDTVAAAPWWCQVPGACWHSPEGPGSDISARKTHPVVHVSWNDAQAYCGWSGERLPTEAEWEYAARGGLTQKLFPWGDELCPQGQHRCNIWQGSFPHIDTGEDGFTGTCPVDAFPANSYGLYSSIGNTWEWCQDWFGIPLPETGLVDPKGPAHGEGRVMKGGSFLCHDSYCNRYRVAARSANAPDSSSSNLGFRCAR